MTKPGRKYKRNPFLKRESAKRRQDLADYLERLEAWDKLFRGKPSDLAMNRIADLLARLGFEPNEEGIPQGDWPSISKTSPLAFLDALKIEMRLTNKEAEEHSTLKFKADILTAATLAWARIGWDEIMEIEGLTASERDVYLLLTFSDIEGFWRGPGKGNTADDVRNDWENGKVNPEIWDASRFNVDERQLQKMLERAVRGG